MTGLETARQTFVEISMPILGLDHWTWLTNSEQSITADRQDEPILIRVLNQFTFTWFFFLNKKDIPKTVNPIVKI